MAAAVSQLAGVTLALLAGDEATAHSLAGGAERKRVTVQRVLAAYDVCASGTLSREEAQALFTSLARSIVSELAASGASEVARAHAQRILEDDERGTIARVASKLLQLADLDGDGRVSLTELAGLFEAVQRAQHASSDTFPQPLRALAGSLQLLPPTEGTAVSEAERAAEWHIGIPGDDHTLRRVEIGRELSVVGLGRSADASAYFLPELGLVLDAGTPPADLKPAPLGPNPPTPPTRPQPQASTSSRCNRAASCSRTATATTPPHCPPWRGARRSSSRRAPSPASCAASCSPRRRTF